MSRFAKIVCFVFVLYAMQSPTVAHGDCDMIGILITNGQTITDVDGLGEQVPDAFNEPSDFWEWFKNTQIPELSRYNDDGYGIIYYGLNPPNPQRVVEYLAIGGRNWEDHLDNQVFRYDIRNTGPATAFAWAEDLIWGSDGQDPHNAFLILAHTRAASGGNEAIDDPHPFIWDYPWPNDDPPPQGENTDETHTYSFQHNGTVSPKQKLRDMTEELWASWHPGQTWSDVYPYKTERQGNNELVDSEAYFHWIVCNIKLAGDVEEGMRRALIAMKEWNDYRNFVFADGDKMYAYRGLRTIPLSDPDGHHRLVYWANEPMSYYAVSSGKPEDADDGLYTTSTDSILDRQMVEFDVNGSMTTHDLFDAPQYHGLPYACDFENSASSTVNSSWYLNTHDDDSEYGSIEVEYDAGEGNRYLEMSNTAGQTDPIEASLHLDLGGLNGVVLEFSYAPSLVVANPNDGVYFSDDGGENFTLIPVYEMAGTSGEWQDVALNVDALCALHGLNLTSTFVVKFVLNDDIAGSNSVGIDNISIYTVLYVPGHYDHIQWAIDALPPESEDIIVLTAAYYNHEADRNIDYGGRGITVRSQSGDPALCVIDCNDDGKGFDFHNNEDASSVLEGVTVMNGSESGIYCYEASPTIRDCIIQQNSSAGGGGGVYCGWGASPSFENCFLIGNTATANGGGISCYMVSSPTFLNCTLRGNLTTSAGGGVVCSSNCSPIFTSCHIDSNTAETGGGVCCQSSSNPIFTACHIDSNTATINGGGVYSISSSPRFSYGCHIDNNLAGDNGGGVYCYLGAPSFTSGCYINDNTAGMNGGGFYFLDTSPPALTLGGSCVEGNSAGDNGGGVYCTSSSPSVDSCSVSHNTAETDNGGGVYCVDSSSPTFTHCRIDGNSAHLFGGGVYCENSSDPEFTSCHIDTNTALISGGGVHCDGSSPEFSECDIKYNTATTGSAGGVRCDGSSPIFTHCNIDSNSAHSYGGGMLCQASSSPVLDKCTIWGNSAGESGGGMWTSSSADPGVTNCLVIENTAGDHGGGLLCNGSAGTFAFCTFSDNVASGLDARGGGAYCTFFSQTIFNSTIIAFSEGSGIYFKQSSGCQVEYCDLFGNAGGNVAYYNDDPAEGPAVIGAIHGNPDFVDRPAGDFHLSDNSACIGLADPLDYPDDDFYEDNPRPDPPLSIPDIGADENERNVPTAVDDIEVLPSRCVLSQNYPNPFNPITRIEYAIPDQCRVRLTIYNVLGERVTTLVDERQAAGYKAVQWDARNQSGKGVASGIYFYRLEAGEYVEVRKMILLR